MAKQTSSWATWVLTIVAMILLHRAVGLPWDFIAFEVSGFVTIALGHSLGVGHLLLAGLKKLDGILMCHDIFPPTKDAPLTQASPERVAENATKEDLR